MSMMEDLALATGFAVAAMIYSLWAKVTLCRVGCLGRDHHELQEKTAGAVVKHRRMHIQAN